MIGFVLLAVCLLSTASTFDDDDDWESSFIFGGSYIDIDEAPWSASIQLIVEDQVESVASVPACYGTIVSSTVIVTAAQCIAAGYGPSSYRVRVGSFSSTIGGQIFEPKWLLPHEDYDERFYTNDIGLMYLYLPITIATAKPVSLPFQGDDVEVGEYATAIGWKFITDPDDPYYEELQEAETNIIDVGLCQLSNIEIANPADVICAGDPEDELESCFAYTGGALMVDDVMVGVFSWSYGCQIPALPGVYTKVSSHMDWLIDRLNVTWSYTHSLAKLQLWNS